MAYAEEIIIRTVVIIVGIGDTPDSVAEIKHKTIVTASILRRPLPGLAVVALLSFPEIVLTVMPEIA